MKVAIGDFIFDKNKFINRPEKYVHTGAYNHSYDEEEFKSDLKTIMYALSSIDVPEQLIGVAKLIEEALDIHAYSSWNIINPKED